MRDALLILIFLMFNKVELAFSQQNPITYVSTYEQYKELFKSPQDVHSIAFNLNKSGQDSLSKYGVNLSEFKHLVIFYFFEQFEDSILESKLFLELGQLQSLNTLLIRTHFRHQFKGFGQLKNLTLEKETDFSNPAFENFSSVTHLAISKISINKAQPTSKIFEWPLIETIEIHGLTDSLFPFDLLSNYPKLNRIQIYECSLVSIPESWRNIPLSVIDLTYSEIQNYFAEWFCNKKFDEGLDLNIYSKQPMKIHECLLENLSINLSIWVEGDFDKKTLKKLKKIKRNIEHANRVGKRKNDIWHKKTMNIHVY